jgi:hypothetical protein
MQASTETGISQLLSGAVTPSSLTCDINNIDCKQVGCLGKCGILDSFENQTFCTVIVSILLPGSTEWVPLGPAFAPGEKWVLTDAAFYLPADSRLRAIHAQTGGVIKDFGTLGAQRRSFVLPVGECNRSTHGGDDNDDWTFRNTDFQRCLTYRGDASIEKNIFLTCLGVVLTLLAVAGLLTVYGFFDKFRSVDINNVGDSVVTATF